MKHYFIYVLFQRIIMYRVIKCGCGLVKHARGESWCIKRFRHRLHQLNWSKTIHSLSNCRYTHTDQDLQRSRMNSINIQMLSKKLHEQIFGQTEGISANLIDSELLQKIQYHLESHGLWNKECPIIPDVDLKLPQLLDKNIDLHFQELGMKQTASYRMMAELLVNSKIPKQPKTWVMAAGWTKYDTATGKTVSVDFPEEDVFVFDIELLVQEGHYPTMATAVSTKHW